MKRDVSASDRLLIALDRAHFRSVRAQYRADSLDALVAEHIEYEYARADALAEAEPITGSIQ